MHGTSQNLVRPRCRRGGLECLARYYVGRVDVVVEGGLLLLHIHGICTFDHAVSPVAQVTVSQDKVYYVAAVSHRGIKYIVKVHAGFCQYVLEGFVYPAPGVGGLDIDLLDGKQIIAAVITVCSTYLPS